MKDLQGEALREIAKEVLLLEASAIKALVERIGESFDQAMDHLLECRGRVIVTGMGKPGIIARKISATLASTGTPSLYVHPAEATHGDLGMIQEEDVIVIISNSGETEEIVKLIPHLKKIGSKLIAMTGNMRSSLASYSDVVLDISVKKEACPLGLAPTASTTVTLAMGDALAMALLEKKGFRHEDYAFYHPGGSLGKRLLLRVKDIMRTGSSNPIVHKSVLLKETLIAITKAHAGAASITNDEGKLVGIFTDGDLRRNVEKEFEPLNTPIGKLMTSNPVTVLPEELAEDAYKKMQKRKIDELPVVDKDGCPVGMIDVQDLLKCGIV
ncbi:MAG: KpsF/GutQ family sugar-phosphate isomerase [Candidatus Theseobacter exili]|nr:KpsF/GutQ family sugar-phosphate isomerase [Candidatus Theseobacter exili]